MRSWGGILPSHSQEKQKQKSRHVFFFFQLSRDKYGVFFFFFSQKKQSINGGTPFYIACQEGHIEIMELLIKDQRIDINQATNDSETPL